jgi:integrase
MLRADLTTLQQFIDHLRKLDVVPHRKLVPDRSPLAEILSAYGQYLRSERGLISGTIREYQSYARMFLVERFRRSSLVLRAIKASDISHFVLRHCRNLSIKRAQLMTTAFRSFFRFLFQKGKIETDLAASIPGVPDWRQATVPKYLTPEEVQRVLGACNRRTPTGAVTTPSFFCLPVLAFALARSFPSNSMTLTGELAKSWCAVKGCAMIGCRCLTMWARPWHPICAEIARGAKHAGYSFA